MSDLHSRPMIELKHWPAWRWILRRPRLVCFVINVGGWLGLLRHFGFRDARRLLPCVRLQVLTQIDRDLEAIENELERLHRLRRPRDFGVE